MTGSRAGDGAGDSELVAASLRGDKDAFGALVERYWRSAVAIAMARVGNAAEAEDVAQESFISAYSQLSTLRDPERFAGWLSKIVTQRSIDHLRRTAHERAKIVPASDSSMLEAASTPPASSGLTAEEAHSVREAVRKLPEGLRDVVILRFVTGLSAGQIAQRLGRKPVTVRVWLHRASRMLAKALAPLGMEVRK